MMTDKIVVVFVHGWSVTNIDTYGGLPARLSVEANALGIDIQLEEIYLGRYISFHDEIRVSDISRAFSAAVENQLSGILKNGTRFVCIAHSTGGPVIRDWWHRYYETVPQSEICPMSHLIMLSPANFGSALAQLGKSRIGRLKFWFGGVEPGQGVLDWLELGSAEAWNLNVEWINSNGSQIGPDGVFPFVLTGQSIDRSLFDNLNTYTGEIGSDGVVRVAAANLNSTYIKLEQELPKPGKKKGEFIADKLEVKPIKQSPTTVLGVISGKSHSGKDMGIMSSVKAALNDKKSQETVAAILACIQVKTNDQYVKLSDRFLAETETVQKNEQLEVQSKLLLSDNFFIHDRFSMVIFRVYDDKGHPVTDYDLILTAGPDADPNHLPKGFFADRQRNNINHETITYFFNRDVMKGTEAVKDKKGNVIREAIKGTEMLGFKIIARPSTGFVHYLPCEIKASQAMLDAAIHRNSTTLVEICLRRVVRKNVFLVDKLTRKINPNFKDTKPGDEIVE